MSYQIARCIQRYCIKGGVVLAWEEVNGPMEYKEEVNGEPRNRPGCLRKLEMRWKRCCRDKCSWHWDNWLSMWGMCNVIGSLLHTIQKIFISGELKT